MMFSGFMGYQIACGIVGGIYSSFKYPDLQGAPVGGMLMGIALGNLAFMYTPIIGTVVFAYHLINDYFKARRAIKGVKVKTIQFSGESRINTAVYGIVKDQRFDNLEDFLI
jgi:hypothetical protein